MTQTKAKKNKHNDSNDNKNEEEEWICCLCGLLKFLHEGKCNNIQENKHGRIYTSTVPNKTIPFFLLFLCFFLVFGIVLMDKEKCEFCINLNNVLILYLKKL